MFANLVTTLRGAGYLNNNNEEVTLDLQIEEDILGMVEDGQ